MVAGSILFAKFVQLIRNLVLQTNTFSNRQPTKVNLTPTISDQKMRVFVVAGNIKRHIFIQKQDSQNQKEKGKNQTTNKNSCHQSKKSVILTGRCIFLGSKKTTTNNNTISIGSTKNERRREKLAIDPGYLIPTWGHLSLANVGRSWAAGATLVPRKRKGWLPWPWGRGLVKDGDGMGLVVGFGRLVFRLDTTNFFDYEKGFLLELGRILNEMV